MVLWWLAEKRYDDAVAELAPAPIGCDTTLVFDRAGTYTFFVETKGSVGEIDGDCDADDRSYDLGDADPPQVGLTLIDDAGQEVDLDRADGPMYDSSGSRGSGVRTVDIEDTGDYVLTADADDDEAMIRVGRDPSTGVTAMRVGAIAVLIAGVVLGVVALVLAQRRPAGAARRSSPRRRRGRILVNGRDRLRRRTPTRRCPRPTSCRLARRPNRRVVGPARDSPFRRPRRHHRHHRGDGAQSRRITVTTRP